MLVEQKRYLANCLILNPSLPGCSDLSEIRLLEVIQLGRIAAAMYMYIGFCRAV